MSACHNLRSCSPLKTVLERTGDTKLTVIPIKYMLWLPTMEAQDNPWTREEQPVEDTNVEVQQDFHPEDTNHFEDLEHNNPTRLHFITRELDDLHQRIQAEEG